MDIRPPTTLEGEDPESAASLLAYLERRGDVANVQQAQLLKARGLYVSKFWHVKRIAKELKIQPSVIERWAFAFGWDEERDRRLFNQFQKINRTREKNAKNIDDRADSIFHGIERVAEEMLQKHMDAGEDGAADLLGVKDLSVLAKTVRDCNESRRTIHGKTNKAQEHKHTHELQLSEDLFAQVGHMVQETVSPHRQIQEHRKQSIVVENIEDAEYEELLD